MISKSSPFRVRRRATAYLRESIVFVHARAQTTDGVWIYSGHLLQCNKFDAVGLGLAVSDALAHSTQHISPATQDMIDDLERPLWVLMEANNRGEFLAGMKVVDIEADGETVKFLPMLCADDLRMPILRKVSEIRGGDDEAKGRALLTAFEHAVVYERRSLD